MMKVRKKVGREFPAAAFNETRKGCPLFALLSRHIEIFEDLARLSAHVIYYARKRTIWQPLSLPKITR